MTTTQKPRNITRHDERHGNVTVRRYFENGVFLRADIFKLGERDTIVKTERGIRNAVARLA